jgi:hypothetical protein
MGGADAGRKWTASHDGLAALAAEAAGTDVDRESIAHRSLVE